MNAGYIDCMKQLHYAWSRTNARAVIRTIPEDFIVEEKLGFQPDGHGEHVFLYIRKRNMNTEYVARILARHAGTRTVSVGYAGLKDRFACTSQYFTVHLPGARDDSPDWTELEGDQLKILSVSRHSRKLRRGGLAENLFRLRLREVQGNRDDLSDRLQTINAAGVPNYFMEQRFGHECNNLVQAERLLLQGKRIKDRHKRGLYLSAARSWLFNLVLSRRVEMNNWDTGLNGDSFMLDGSRSCFLVDVVDNDIEARLVNQEIHPAGPLWGGGRNLATATALQLEEEALKEWEHWKAGLEQSGVEMGRRRLRSHVRGLEWSWHDANTLDVSFSLAPGSYATAVLRELCDIRESDRRD